MPEGSEVGEVTRTINGLVWWSSWRLLTCRRCDAQKLGSSGIREKPHADLPDLNAACRQRASTGGGQACKDADSVSFVRIAQRGAFKKPDFKDDNFSPSDLSHLTELYSAVLA